MVRQGCHGCRLQIWPVHLRHWKWPVPAGKYMKVCREIPTQVIWNLFETHLKTLLWLIVWQSWGKICYTKWIKLFNVQARYAEVYRSYNHTDILNFPLIFPSFLNCFLPPIRRIFEERCWFNTFLRGGRGWSKWTGKARAKSYHELTVTWQLKRCLQLWDGWRYVSSYQCLTSDLYFYRDDVSGELMLFHLVNQPKALTGTCLEQYTTNRLCRKCNIAMDDSAYECIGSNRSSFVVYLAISKSWMS